MKNTILGCLEKVASGVLAGLLISLGGGAFLSCVNAATPYSRYLGAFLFTLALVCICMLGYALYTGKIGQIYEKHKKEDISLLLLCLLGNAIGTIVCGYLIAWIIPGIKQTAYDLCTGKLGQGYGFGFLRAVFCGILVYLSVETFRKSKSALGILLCIPAFIVSGYEHSIADMFYFAASGIVSGQAFLYLILIILGNSVGGLLIPTLLLIHPKRQEPSASVPAKETAEVPVQQEAEQEAAVSEEKN